MSGLLNKAKEAMGKSGGKYDKQADGYLNKGMHLPTSLLQSTSTDTLLFSGIDEATDRVGMGDKYDDKISKFADGQLNKQMGGGAGTTGTTGNAAGGAAGGAPTQQ